MHKKKDELEYVAKIFAGLSEPKKNIWIGNGSLLLASQQMEENKNLQEEQRCKTI